MATKSPVDTVYYGLSHLFHRFSSIILRWFRISEKKHTKSNGVKPGKMQSSMATHWLWALSKINASFHLPEPRPELPFVGSCDVFLADRPPRICKQHIPEKAMVEPKLGLFCNADHNPLEDHFRDLAVGTTYCRLFT
jgi:hypothetical protein